MMEEKTVFFVDIDGTLMDGGFVLKQEVLDQAEAYRKSGGKIVLCTGRSVIGARPVAERMRIQSPAILFNGAAIYDFGSEKFLWKFPMDKKVLAAAKCVYERCPGVCVQIYTEADIFQLRTNRMVESRGVPEERSRACRSFPEIWQPILKLTLIAEREEELWKCQEFFSETNFAFEISGRHFAEIVQKGCGKKQTAEKYLTMQQERFQKIFAAGNGKNDKELLRMSHMAFVPADAGDEVLECADQMIASPQNGGMKQAFETARQFTERSARSER